MENDYQISEKKVFFGEWWQKDHKTIMNEETNENNENNYRHEWE